MTRKEAFHAILDQERWRRRTARYLWVAVGAAAVFGTVAARYLVAPTAAPPTGPAIVCGAVLVVLIGGAVLSDVLRRRATHASVPCCPGCRRRFDRQALTDLGYTGTCKFCGVRVLDNETPDAARAQAGRQRLYGAIQAYRRESVRQLRTLGILIVAGLMAAVGIVLAILPGHAPSGGLVGATLIIAFLVFLVCVRAIRQRLSKRFALGCPSCDRLFDEQALRNLGYADHCRFCGGRVLDPAQ